MEAISCRLRPLLRHVISRCFSPTVERFRLFSSLAEDNNRQRYKGSAVYQHTLKFQRPSTIQYTKELQNFVSFIGTVYLPLKQINTRKGRLGVHTLLNVNSSGDSGRHFRILLQMWDEMAEISIKHLKPNDYIYVSGHLESYRKVDEDGKLGVRNTVIVKEINYVVQYGQGASWKDAERSGSGDKGEDILEKRRNRLHLWQVFFVNPHEWKDFRKHKVNPNHPDFKHWGADEALWLRPDDPPWIMRQLQLHDSRLREKGLQQHLTYHLNLTPLGYDN